MTGQCAPTQRINVDLLRRFGSDRYKGMLSYLVVDNIDYIEDERYGSLKRVSYYKAGWEHRRVTIYERYGDVTGWATSSHAEIDGMGPGHVICAFDENDEYCNIIGIFLSFIKFISLYLQR